MELERPKKAKHRKPRELSPPPSVLLTSYGLDEKYDACEHQPSTSGVESEDTMKEIGNDEIAINEGNAAKSDHIFSTQNSSIDTTEKFVFLSYIRRPVLSLRD